MVGDVIMIILISSSHFFAVNFTWGWEVGRINAVALDLEEENSKLN